MVFTTNVSIQKHRQKETVCKSMEDVCRLLQHNARSRFDRGENFVYAWRHISRSQENKKDFYFEPTYRNPNIRYVVWHPLVGPSRGYQRFQVKHLKRSRMSFWQRCLGHIPQREWSWPSLQVSPSTHPITQIVEQGYEFFGKRKLVTVFSATNYCSMFQNWGAIMNVNSDLICSFEVIKPENGNK